MLALLPLLCSGGGGLFPCAGNLHVAWEAPGPHMLVPRHLGVPEQRDLECPAQGLTPSQEGGRKR